MFRLLTEICVCVSFVKSILCVLDLLTSVFMCAGFIDRGLCVCFIC